MKARFAIGEIEFHGEGEAKATAEMVRSFVNSAFPVPGSNGQTAIAEDEEPAALPAPEDEPEDDDPVAEELEPVKPKKKRKSPVRRQSADGQPSNADKMVEFLKRSGPSRSRDISEATGIPSPSINVAANDPRIKRISRGVYGLAGAAVAPKANGAMHDPFDDEDDDETTEEPAAATEAPAAAHAPLSGDMIAETLGTGKLSTVDLCNILKVDRARILVVLNNDDRFDMDIDGNWLVK